MKKKMFMKMVTLGASVLTLIALALSASACWWALYQPEEPKCLTQK